MTASATKKAKSDLDVIVPTVQTVPVAGVECKVKRLKMRELMQAVNVVTTGAGSSMQHIDLSGAGAAEFGALLLMAIPAAGDEFTDLLGALLEPVEKLSEKDSRWVEFQAELRNPDPEVGLEVARILLEQEADTIDSLLGKGKMLFSAAQTLFRKKAAS